ncbi:thioredoxin family protein [Pontibacter sp. G13]|uniref:thioredoxin family protein n=1 Tax=Pontibacter sp. G13 TaxID=3074898 RepID=UPI002889D4C9|nr:thioredoxin family protein [Pontibacter sp. G13]WNJ20210.1 thioredoxin family protein [Pontibacter sp. G13]
MKNIFLAAFLLMAGSLSAQVNLFEGSFEEALAKAKAEDKPLLIDAYTDWCGPCKMLDREVFQNEEAGAYINEHFVAYKLDMEKGEGPFVAMKFRVKSYPSTLFIGADGHLIDKVIGYGGVAGYLKTCGEMLEKPHFENINANNWKLDFPEFYRTTFTSDSWERAKPDPEKTNAFLAEQEDLSTEVNWSIISGMSYYGHDYLGWAVENREELLTMYPKSEVDNVVDKALSEAMKEVVEANPEISALDAATAVGTKFNMELVGESRDKLVINFLYGQQDFAGLLAYLEDGISTEPQLYMVNSIAWRIYQRNDDQDVILRAIALLEKALEKEEEHNSMDTLAHLYYKANQMDKAKVAAERTLELAEEAGADMPDTVKLLEKLSE